LSAKYTDNEIHPFIKSYVKSKEGKLNEKSDQIFTLTFPNDEIPKEYTYQPVLSREKKVTLMSPGSPAFQQIVKECLENGVLCQVLLNPKENIDTLVRRYFKDSPFVCGECEKITLGVEIIGTCVKSPTCHHRINNGQIASAKVSKKESVRYFQFYFSITFQNKLRPKNEEIISITMDEKGEIADTRDFNEDNILNDEMVEIQDFKSKLEASVFDKLKKGAEEKLKRILKGKLILFDLPLAKEKKTKIRSFDKRLRRERREKVISRKHDFDVPQWRANYEALLKREEESYVTNIAVKFINLLVINTSKIRFEVNLDNNSTIQSSLILGVNHASEVNCPICKKSFSEGYATQDALYVCGNCIKQSVDTAKIYSKKEALNLDETLKEYFEHDSGFVCSVCGKRHSRLLEFKCSHDNSSVCVNHYGLCDICGNIFSKLNLVYTEEFKHQLCPKHAVRCESCQSVIGVSEGKLCKATGKRWCSKCMTFTKCTLCQQEYSAKCLVDDRCPACNSLKESNDQMLTLIVQNFDKSQQKTTKWLIGRNATNAVVVAKGLFSNLLYVIENDQVVYQKSISFLDKLKER
jgi:hypothetical protein